MKAVGKPVQVHYSLPKSGTALPMQIGGRALETLLVNIRGRLLKGHYGSESAVREALILRILQALGWRVSP